MLACALHRAYRDSPAPPTAYPSRHLPGKLCGFLPSLRQICRPLAKRLIQSCDIHFSTKGARKDVLSAYGIPDSIVQQQKAKMFVYGRGVRLWLSDAKVVDFTVIKPTHKIVKHP